MRTTQAGAGPRIRFGRPSRVVAVLATLGAFPGCHGTSLPIGDFLSSGAGSSDGFGILLCMLALIAASALLVRWARD